MFNNYNCGEEALARSKFAHLMRMDMLICSSKEITLGTSVAIMSLSTLI